MLGLSGGIDSALTLVCAVDALGAENVHAVMMPYLYTAEISVTDARRQAEILGCEFSVVSIEPMVREFMGVLGPFFEGHPVDATEENIQSRCRGILLMALSNKTGALVLTTGNKSEMAVGYATLYGDMAGGFAVLKDVWKTRVYDLARFVNLDRRLSPNVSSADHRRLNLRLNRRILTVCPLMIGLIRCCHYILNPTNRLRPSSIPVLIRKR